jgi:hypothetical protein
MPGRQTRLDRVRACGFRYAGGVGVKQWWGERRRRRGLVRVLAERTSAALVTHVPRSLHAPSLGLGDGHGGCARHDARTLHRRRPRQLSGGVLRGGGPQTTRHLAEQVGPLRREAACRQEAPPTGAATSSWRVWVWGEECAVPVREVVFEEELHVVNAHIQQPDFSAYRFRVQHDVVIRPQQPVRALIHKRGL